MVRYLLDTGARPSIQDSGRQTPLHWAAERGNLRIVNLLLDSITAPKSSSQPPLSSSTNAPGPLPQPAPESPSGSVQSNTAWNESPADMLNQTNSQGETALMLAIRNAKDETVRLLLRKGAKHGMDLDQKDGRGKTALHLAVDMKKEKLVEELVGASALQTALDGLERTPLFLAVQHGHEKAVDALLQDMPYVVRQQSDKHGRSALHAAVERGHLGILKKLLEERFYEDAKDDLGRTPLLLAADNGDKDVVDLLLSHNARQDLEDATGRTPLFLAVANGDLPIAKTLLSRSDAPITAENSQSLLHLVVKSRSKAGGLARGRSLDPDAIGYAAEA